MVELECAWCKTKFKRKKNQLKNSKSGLFFCCRKHKDAAQKLGGLAEIMPAHYGTAVTPDYRSFFTDEELVCKRCGYKEFKVSIDIHHIDGDRSNNHKTNLIPLCVCCHRAYHSKLWSFAQLIGSR